MNTTAEKISRAKAQRRKENHLELRKRSAPLRLCARNIFFSNRSAAFGRITRGLCVTVAIIFTLGALAVMQLLVVGSFDRLGVSPQHGFLAFNLILITGLLGRSVFPIRIATRGVKSGLAAPVNSSGDLVCKVLIIRRLNFLSDDMTACRNFSERTDTNAIVAHD
jgi:hypothetical protein